jgi:hypothetical protein
MKNHGRGCNAVRATVAFLRSGGGHETSQLNRARRPARPLASIRHDEAAGTGDPDVQTEVDLNERELPMPELPVHLVAADVLRCLAGPASPGWTRLLTVGTPGWHARLLDVSLSPDPSNLPGGGTLQQLTNGLGGWALILSLVGLLVGAAAWALGAHSQNYHQSFVGRRAVLVSGVAALLIGAGPILINFFFHAGTGLH